MSRFKWTSKTLSDLARKFPDRIESIERDDTGWMIHLTEEWVDDSDPLQPCRLIFEDTVKECVAAFRGIRKATRKERSL